MATITTMAFMATFAAPKTVAQPSAALPSRQNVVPFAARSVRAHGRRLVAVAGSPSTPPELAQKVTDAWNAVVKRREADNVKCPCELCKASPPAWTDDGSGEVENDA